jgi:hypothetical protein
MVADRTQPHGLATVAYDDDGAPSQRWYLVREYVITVKAGHSEHTVRVSDTTMPKSLTPLVNELISLRVAG